jgi:hypothetical protein
MVTKEFLLGYYREIENCIRSTKLQKPRRLGGSKTYQVMDPGYFYWPSPSVFDIFEETRRHFLWREPEILIPKYCG